MVPPTKRVGHQDVKGMGLTGLQVYWIALKVTTWRCEMLGLQEASFFRFCFFRISCLLCLVEQILNCPQGEQPRLKICAYAGTNLQSKDWVGAGYSGLHSKGRWPSEPRAIQISPHFFSCQIANIYTWCVRRHSPVTPRVIRDDCFKHIDTERFGDCDIVKL